MFPIQPNHELVFGTPTTSQGYQIYDDLITNHDFLENNLINFSIGSNEDKEPSTRPVSAPRRQKQKESKHECSGKKVMHREVERKRRQEMSNLYSSLRSLLPEDQIKGKRSVCEQMQEATIYIKTMEKNIEELKIRRDELKSSFNSSSGNLESSNETNIVRVNMVSNGMEILISHSSNRSDFVLSRVLGELQQCDDLDVISSVSTKMNERFIHQIQVAARVMKDLDVFLLQDRLSEAIK